MKKITMFFLAVLALTFVACGKGEGGIVDKIKSLDNTTSQSEASSNSFNNGEYLDIDKEKRRYFRIQNSKNVIIYIN